VAAECAKAPPQQVSSDSSCIAPGQRHQADNFKKISSWAAILFAPTLVGTIYG
jgi:magnesium transporter